jgi:hypothetical protein
MYRPTPLLFPVFLQLIVQAPPARALERPAVRKGFSVQADVTVQLDGQTRHTKKHRFLAAGDAEWKVLSDLNEGLLLLGRMIREREDGIDLEYLVLDVNRNPNVLVRTPPTTVYFVYPHHMLVRQSSQEKVFVTVFARPARS